MPRHRRHLTPSDARRLILPTLIAAGAWLLAATSHASAPPPPPELPGCETGARPALGARYEDWPDTLLDPSHSLGPAYEPPDLVRGSVGGRRVTLRSFVFGPLREMLAAAAKDGISIGVTSAYRSFEEQRELVASMPGQEDLVARPGHSEHQLGTAVDLRGGGEWLAREAWRFGFLLSYPAGRSPDWTCYRFEPWHYRYFGRDRAGEIGRSGLSPREWLWVLHSSAGDG